MDLPYGAPNRSSSRNTAWYLMDSPWGWSWYFNAPKRGHDGRVWTLVKCRNSGHEVVGPQAVEVRLPQIDGVLDLGVEGTGKLFLGSLPLNRAWRLAGDVVDHPVDPGHLVDDAVGHPAQQIVR